MSCDVLSLRNRARQTFEAEERAEKFKKEAIAARKELSALKRKRHKETHP